MKTRTADSQDLLKNFDLAHKLTKREDAQKKLTALRKFLPKLNVMKATMQYCAGRAHDITREFRTISEH